MTSLTLQVCTTLHEHIVSDVIVYLWRFIAVVAVRRLVASVAALEQTVVEDEIEELKDRDD